MRPRKIWWTKLRFEVDPGIAIYGTGSAIRHGREGGSGEGGGSRAGRGSEWRGVGHGPI